MRWPWSKPKAAESVELLALKDAAGILTAASDRLRLGDYAERLVGDEKLLSARGYIFRQIRLHFRILPVLLLAVSAFAGDPHPRLTARAFPAVTIASPGRPASIMVTAEAVGPETEEWYCPEVTFVAPNDTKSVEESDCAPFENRDECWPPPGPEHQPRIVRGELVPGAPYDCTVTGYPKRWSRRYLIGPCPYENSEACTYRVTVHLAKTGREFAVAVAAFQVR